MFKLPISLAVFLALVSAIGHTSAAVNHNIYNPAYSSMINWGDPNRGPDQTITIPYAGTTLSATTAVTVAGSVVSLKVGSKEFIASGGHGSGLGWTFKPELPLYGIPYGECYNPTSGGTAGDDHRPGYTTAPYHGPSTSAILQPLWQRPWDKLITNVRMAFYVLPGTTGFECQANYPNHPSYTYGEGYGILSPFVLGQTVSLGRQTDAGWLPNVLNVQGNTTLDSTAFVHGDIYDNVGIAYLLEDFTNFYSFNGTPGAPDQGLTAVSRVSQAFYNGRMPVIATANGAYAMGLIEGQSAQQARNVAQGTLPARNERHYYWIEVQRRVGRRWQLPSASDDAGDVVSHKHCGYGLPLYDMRKSLPWNDVEAHDALRVWDLKPGAIRVAGAL